MAEFVPRRHLVERSTHMKDTGKGLLSTVPTVRGLRPKRGADGMQVEHYIMGPWNLLRGLYSRTISLRGGWNVKGDNKFKLPWLQL